MLMKVKKKSYIVVKVRLVQNALNEAGEKREEWPKKKCGDLSSHDFLLRKSQRGGLNIKRSE